MYHFGTGTYFEAHTILCANCFPHHGHTTGCCLRESHQNRAFFGRLSRAGLLESIWTAHLPTQQTTALGPRRAGSSFQSVDSNVPQRAHEFVSIQLAVPRARPASRQQLSLKPERLLVYQISMSDIQERVGYSDSILCRYTEHNHKNIKRKRLWL
jgi:hypothetical protein